MDLDKMLPFVKINNNTPNTGSTGLKIIKSQLQKNIEKKEKKPLL
jgi:hypothetical protein